MKYNITLVFLLLFTVSHLPAQTGSTLAAVSMADANNGIAVGFSGTILRTVNGGTTWAPQTSGTTNNLYSVDLSSTSFGTTVGGDPLFGGGRVLRTSNGGVTWSSQSSGTGALLLGISLPDANNGTAVGNNGVIIHTTNGGATWISQSSGTSNHLYEVQFVDANNGFISGSQGTVLRTIDGGVTWIKQTTGTPYSLYGVSFVNTNVGTVVGDGGVILRTLNAGSTWTSQTSGTTTALRSVSFIDANNGIVVGDGGAIRRTTDGGTTWVSQTSGTPYSLNGVYMINLNTAIVVGYNSIILKTTNGGQTWAQQTISSGSPPAVPLLSSPVDGSTNQPLTISLFWNASSGATSYHLQVSSSSTFSTLLVNDSTLTTMSRQVTSLANSTTYYWRVSAKNNYGTSGYSTTWSFLTLPTLPTAPLPPTLTTPSNGAGNQPTSLMLFWNASTGAATYRVQVSTSSTFATTVVDDSTLATTSRQVSGLANTTTYYWRVNAKNTGGTSAYSSTWNFATITAAPAAPTLVSPSNGATGQPTTLTLSWNASSGASTYRLQVSTSSTFATTVVDDSTLATTSRQVSGLTNTTTYYWRVNAKNTGGTSAYSSTWNFATITAAPAAPTLVSPSNGATGQPTTLTLSWNASSGASTYRLQVSTSSTFATTIVNDSTITATSRQLSGLTNTTTYYWRVNAKNTGGTSAYSGTWSFITSAPPPPVFSVTPTSIDFGTVAVGVSLTNSVTVTNTGGSTLTISNIVSTSSKYTVSPTSGSLAAGVSMTVNITFTPTNKTTATANINFTHNAAGSPGVVTVSGKGGSGPKGPRQPSETVAGLPLEFALLQNYPNPFNPATIIEYELPEPSMVQLTIYNSLGQHVVSLVERQIQSGYQTIEWSAVNNSGNPLPSGIYYYRMHAISQVSSNEFNEIRKMILMK